MSIGNKRPPSGATEVGKRPAVDPRAEPQTIPPAPPSEQRSATLPAGMASIHKQLTSLQLQLAEAQRHIAQHQDERAVDTDRLAEMLKRLSRTEIRARAAEAGLGEAVERAAEAERRALELRTLEAEVLELRSGKREGPEDTAKIAALQAELDERALRLDELQTTAKRSVSTLESEVSELRAAQRDALEGVAKIAALRTELHEKTLRLNDLETAAKGKDEELAGLRRDLNGALEVADAKAKQVETLVVEIDGMQGNETELIARAREATNEIARLAEVAAEVETLRNSVDEAGADNLRLEEELAAEQGRVLALEQCATELAAQHAEQLAAVRAESDARHDTVTARLEVAGRELEASEKKLQELNVTVEALRAEVRVAKTLVEEERAACEAAREDSTSLRALLNDAAAEIDKHSGAQRTVQENADKAAESLEALERAEADLILARQNVSEHVKALRGTPG